MVAENNGPTREEVSLALFSLFDNSTTFAMTTRRWVNYQTDPEAMRPQVPYLVQFEGIPESMDYRGSRGLPPIRTWGYLLFAYGMIPESQTQGVPDSTTPGAQVLNPLIDAIETALRPGPLDDGVQTLGGLVVDCRIEGEIMKAVGDQDPSGLCIAMVPVKVLVQ